MPSAFSASKDTDGFDVAVLAGVTGPPASPKTPSPLRSELMDVILVLVAAVALPLRLSGSPSLIGDVGPMLAVAPAKPGTDSTPVYVVVAKPATCKPPSGVAGLPLAICVPVES